ncbi:MAG: patatin-like phospholipase family protein [Desulfobacteraceae bacterium]|jgi:hypothetical protein
MDDSQIITKEHDEVLKKEWDGYLSRRRNKKPDDWPEWKDKLTGLAISGGGIRSAAFSLGVLQQLASKKLLGMFDYLSTVSGGGYTGGSVSYYLNNPDFDKRSPQYDLKEEFPYGLPDKTRLNPTPELNYLRSHGSYLAPGSGINLLSFAGVVLRAILLNLVIWIPVLILVMAVAQRLVVTGKDSLKDTLPWITNPTALAGLCVFIITFLFGGYILYRLKSIKEPKDLVFPLTKPVRIINWILFFISGWAFSCGVIYKTVKLEKFDFKIEAGTKSLRETFDVMFARISEFWTTEVPVVFKVFEILAVLFVAFFIIMIIYYSLTTIFQKDQTEYKQRRIHAIIYGIILKWLPVCIVVALIPYLSRLADLKGGIGALCTGIAIGLWKLYSKGKEWVPMSIMAPIAALLVLYGLLITAYSISFDLNENSCQIAIGVSFLAVILGYFVNLNHISVGRYYRDRLMEAFQPDEKMIKENKNCAATGANKFTISSLSPKDPEKPKTPYHLVNTNAVLIDSNNSKIKKRGGDSFIFSPLFTGSGATGWVNTEKYNKDFTLATAVSISAAAVNPHTGPDGSGLTRNPAISFLMALLNLRLGYWASNPNMPEGQAPMNHFWSAWYELSPHAGYNEKSTFIQLSDGGHFDNLGLYELFRRRVRFILVLDGGADKDFKFGDLQNALHRAEQDFKVRLKFNRPFGDIIPQEQDKVKFPQGLKLADTGYVSGQFTYGSDVDNPGWFFFIKTTLIDDMSMRIRGYKSAHPDFPDESTADQFFSEDQFDAYRLLGIAIAEQLTNEKDFGKILTSYFGI